jgi:hypothetical protein
MAENPPGYSPDWPAELLYSFSALVQRCVRTLRNPVLPQWEREFRLLTCAALCFAATPEESSHILHVLEVCCQLRPIERYIFGLGSIGTPRIADDELDVVHEAE